MIRTRHQLSIGLIVTSTLALGALAVVHGRATQHPVAGERRLAVCVGSRAFAVGTQHEVELVQHGQRVTVAHLPALATFRARVPLGATVIYADGVQVGNADAGAVSPTEEQVSAYVRGPDCPSDPTS